MHRVLVRNGVNRLRWMDRPTGRVIRRIMTDHCGELVHIDVKKLARIPDGGGHKMHGRSFATRPKGGGYTHIHTAIDGRNGPSDGCRSESAIERRSAPANMTTARRRHDHAHAALPRRADRPISTTPERRGTIKTVPVGAP